MRTGEDLPASAAGAEDGHPFAAKFMGKAERAADIVGSGMRGEVDRFGYAAVAVLLEDRLHPDMMRGGDIMSRRKECTQGFRYPGEVPDRFCFTEGSLQLDVREA